MWQELKGVIGSVAPTIATALGGPLVGGAVSLLTNALGLGENASEQDIVKAIASADPETLAKIKQAELDYSKRIAELGVDLQRLAVQDRASARDMQTATKSRMPAVVALFSLCGFFATLGIMAFVDLPDGAKDAFLIMIGSLGTLVTQIGAFYFGSSDGSERKNELLARMQPTPSPLGRV